MARGLGLTALRVALGGLSGVGQDRAAMREAQRVEQEQARARERQAMLDARQAAMDQTMLYDKGYLSADEAGAARQQAGGGLGRVVSGATLGLLGPGAGAMAAPTSAADLALAKQAGAFTLPQQTITLGGTRFQRPSPIAESMRQAEMTLAQQQAADRQKQAEERRTQDTNVQAAMKAYNLTREQAQEYVRTGKSPLVEAQRPMTAAEKDAAARGWAEINLRREAAKTAGAGGGRRAGATDKTSLATTLPSVTDAAARLNKMNPNDVAKLRPGVMDWAQSAGKASGTFLGIPTGPALRSGVAAFGKPTAQELEYVQTANAVADAIARATDVGVLSNYDIDRFRSQVTPTALDIENPQSAQFKFNILKGWATWLANNRQMLQAADAAYEAGKPLPDAQLIWKGAVPKESGIQLSAGQVDRRGAGQQQDAELEKAQRSIAGGAPKSAVIQLYEQRTGRKWPGG